MSSQWAKNAPTRLIRAYQNREVGKGRILLGRLLSNDWTHSPWTELARHVQTDRQWLRVWSAIASAKVKSNRAVRLPHKSRSEERDDYRALAKKFAKLAKKIEDGPLDVPTYELWGRKDWAALHEPNLNEVAPEQRCDAAYRILRHWPSAVDLLYGLEERAWTLATDAMIKRLPRCAQQVILSCGRSSGQARVYFSSSGKVAGDFAIADWHSAEETDEPTSRSFVQSVLHGYS
jgi:hypothetical protein